MWSLIAVSMSWAARENRMPLLQWFQRLGASQTLFDEAALLTGVDRDCR